jgi:PAS domain S-box-containing protein
MAASAILRKTPDIILLDLTVEDSSGLETLDRMRNIAPKIPIVITTGNDSQLVAQTAVRRGAQDYLFKNNINQDILNRTICNAIDRKTAENENHEKNLILETMIENQVIGHWDWHVAKGRINLSSPIKKMLGYSESELGNQLHELLDRIHTDDKQRVTDSFKQYVDSKGRLPYEYVARFQHKDGNYHWLGCHGKAIEWQEDGQPTRMIGCHIDISTLDKHRDQALSGQNSYFEKTEQLPTQPNCE